MPVLWENDSNVALWRYLQAAEPITLCVLGVQPERIPTKRPIAPRMALGWLDTGDWFRNGGVLYCSRIRRCGVPSVRRPEAAFKQGNEAGILSAPSLAKMTR